MNKTIYILFIQFICSLTLVGQEAEISLLTDEYTNVQVRTNDILQFKVDSYSADKFSASILIEITDQNGKAVSIMKTGEISISPSLNNAEQILSQSTLISQYSTPSFYSATNRQFVFPIGRHQVCISLMNIENGLIDKKCMTVETLNAYELLLIYPYDEDAIDEMNPVFTWTPIIEQNLTYRIKWIETDLNSIDDNTFLSSVPFFVIDNVRNNLFPYSAGARNMSRDKYYFWQVQAYAGNKLIAESDIWQYHFNDAMKVENSNLWFVDVDAVRRDDVIRYVGDEVGFQIENYSTEEPIQFELIDGQGRIVMTEKDIQLEEMEVGKNYFTLQVPQLIEDTPYNLKINTRQKKHSITLIKVEE